MYKILIFQAFGKVYRIIASITTALSMVRRFALKSGEFFLLDPV